MMLAPFAVDIVDGRMICEASGGITLVSVRAVAESGVDVISSGAITVGRAGAQLAPMAEMAELGVRIFTDDGTGVQDDRLMRRAMEYASGLPHDVVLAQHCENDRLAAGGLTVLITTHYMDEAEYCDRVSIMVEGKIEALDTPKKLKEQFKVDSMNDVFLKLARNIER